MFVYLVVGIIIGLVKIFMFNLIIYCINIFFGVLYVELFVGSFCFLKLVKKVWFLILFFVE